ncbi:MAG: ketoacyl-ACP synthase III [Lachnospiraceae bacterium]|nr:ketoacyl-ACP synthase III [Lachnospiraceae bacterium]
MKKVKVIATAAAYPEQVVTNDDLAKIVDTSDEWISQRTGIKERRISSGENTSVFVIETARKLLERAEVSAEEIDLIIVASVTPDYGTPSLACMVQKALGTKNAVCFDIVAACSGFMFALSTADKFIKAGKYRNAIVIGGETLSKIVDWSDRSTCVLFGDGAGGAYIEETDEGGLLRENIGTEGECYEILTEGYTRCANAFNDIESYQDPRWYVFMNGREVFKFATKKVIQSIRQVLDEEGLQAEDIRYFIPHQANARIVEVIAKKLNVPFDRFEMNMERFGNTSSASIPIALNELNEKGLLERGDKIMLSGFGGDMTWATVLIEW